MAVIYFCLCVFGSSIISEIEQNNSEVNKNNLGRIRSLECRLDSQNKENISLNNRIMEILYRHSHEMDRIKNASILFNSDDSYELIGCQTETYNYGVKCYRQQRIIPANRISNSPNDEIKELKLQALLSFKNELPDELFSVTEVYCMDTGNFIIESEIKVQKR